MLWLLNNTRLEPSNYCGDGKPPPSSELFGKKEPLSEKTLIFQTNKTNNDANSKSTKTNQRESKIHNLRDTISETLVEFSKRFIALMKTDEIKNGRSREKSSTDNNWTIVPLVISIIHACK